MRVSDNGNSNAKEQISRRTDYFDLGRTGARLEQVREFEATTRKGLDSLFGDARVIDLHICGAVAAVELAHALDVHAARQWFIDQGVFIRPLGRVVHLAPAFVVISDALKRQIPRALI